MVRPSVTQIVLSALLTASVAFGGESLGESLTVSPPQAMLRGRLERLQIIATGIEAGRTVDRTSQADYENLTPEILKVDQRGLVTPRSTGHGRIRVRYGAQSAEVNVEVKLARQASASFVDHVMPVLTKVGCNLGTCHASQFGKGGFKLSVFGYAPENDFLALTRQWGGRRISTIRPADSLLLQKATLQVSHAGGRRFTKDSYAYEVLSHWIAAGAPSPDENEAAIQAIEITPTVRTYRRGDRQQLRVVAHYDDGSARDVTHRAQFDSIDDSVTTVDDLGMVRVVGRGQTAVMVRYRGQAAAAQMISPFAEKVELADFVPRNLIDEHVKRRWQLLGVQPSGPATDEEFLRRAFLDCLGTLPTPEQIQTFLASQKTDKRAALIGELLDFTGDPRRDVHVDTWATYWTLKLGDMLRNNRKTAGDAGMWSLHNWLKTSLRRNKPFDQLARELVLAQGSIFEYGPANYIAYSKVPTSLATVAPPTELAETTAQVFLGVRLECARCHHHPFEAYSQRDYYGLAAFFTRLTSKSSSAFGELGFDAVVSLQSTGSIKHPRTGEVMRPTPLGGKPLDDNFIGDLRKPLADWMTSPRNRMFSRNIVNRIWAHFMGSGLVEPVDDLRSTNPPSNPELLDALADDFSANGFDLRQLMKRIIMSRVYQLSPTPRNENLNHRRFYTHYNLKRLPAEVLLDAIDFACGTHERFEGVPPGTRAIALPDPNFESYFLDTLGRPQRLTSCECERTAEPNLAQVLHLANGELLQRKLTDKQGRIEGLIKRNATDAEAIRALYLVTFSRLPRDEEIRRCRELIGRSANRREGLENILWALCNSREFLFNH